MLISNAGLSISICGSHFVSYMIGRDYFLNIYSTVEVKCLMESVQRKI